MSYDDNKTHDFEYGARMDWLVQLMLVDPDRPVVELQKEAMDMYPIHHKALRSYWMSTNTMMKAGDILAKKTMEEYEQKKSL